MIDRLFFLVEKSRAQFLFLLLQRFPFIVLVLPVEEIAQRNDHDEQQREHPELRQNRPVADFFGVKPPEVV